jgi:8-oxo-dGTP pyrophosphatase MutT (NUDIX family)
VPDKPEQATSAADQALRSISAAVGDSRPRRRGDGVDPDVPVAATVIIARDGREGPEVLMIERPDRGSFLGAWVFPGGKVDPRDGDAGVEPEEDIARRAGVRETLEEVGLRLDPDGLVSMSCWDPPPGLPLRIRTWFFAARAPESGEITPSEDEVVASTWVRPADMLARHGRGEVTLYPPTWVTLHSLGEQADVDALLGEIRFAGLRRFETVARRLPSGPVLLWEEDAEYDLDEPATGARPGAGARSGVSASARHRLEVGDLPWSYLRSD